jgi:glutaredoxin 3
MEGKVIIYTIPDCPFCKAAKESLETKKTEYKEIDVSENPEAEQEVLKRTDGKRVVPVIVEGEKITIGFKGV